MHADEARSQAWVELRDDLSRVLYEYDPEGMGSSVGAPDDEYDDGAVALIRLLQGRPASASVDPAVRDLWPSATDELVDAVRRRWGRYARHTQ